MQVSDLNNDGRSDINFPQRWFGYLFGYSLQFLKLRSLYFRLRWAWWALCKMILTTTVKRLWLAPGTPGNYAIGLGNGGGTFTTVSTYPVETNATNGISNLMDYTGDGNVDAALYESNAGAIYIMPGLATAPSARPLPPALVHYKPW